MSTALPTRRRRSLMASLRSAVVAVCAAAGVLTLVGVDANVAAAAAPDVITIEGRGWGHGRGLSQYGALGYAVDHGWSSAQILDHFYGNTTAGDPVADDDMTVHLTAFGNDDLLVTSPSAFVIGDVTFDPGTVVGIDVQGVDNFAIYTTGGCGGAPTPVASGLVGTPRQNDHPVLEVVPAAADPSADDTNQMLHTILCDEGAEVARRAYRGIVGVVEIGAEGFSINRLPLEQYLRGVVPRESPTWWGGLGDGAGIAALEAQAVAARSYAVALAADRSSRGFATGTCDTTACQVYGGASINGLPLDHGPIYVNSNAAIAATAGLVRRGGSGQVAFTEFSSSTGGWTVPISEGSPFPDVEDLGDSIGSNPNAVWTTTIARSDIEAAYPAIGTLERIEVTRRNGLGAWGGRTRQIRLEGSDGVHVVNIENWGDDSFRRRFGLRSDWYRFTDFPPEDPPPPDNTGFWVVRSDGAVLALGSADHFGDASDLTLNKPIVGMAPTPTGRGYWLVASDGGIFSYGDAEFFGSTGDIDLNKPIVGMAAHPSGDGYWFVASDGGVFTFGSADFLGSMGGVQLNQPVVGMAPTPTGDGYWLVASDGGVFTFGDARFLGSTGDIRLNEPITGMVATDSGNGYLFVARDGGIFTFGDGVFRGSRGASDNRASVVGLATVRGDDGYWIVLADGTSYPYGNAPDFISSAAGRTVVGVARVP